MTSPKSREDSQEPCRDPFDALIPERMWIDVTNIGVRAEGMVRVVLTVNEQEKELYHSYVTDGIVSHGYSLTSWLLKARNAEIAAKDALLAQAAGALEKCHEELVGHLMHEGGDLNTALERSDAALAKLKAAGFVGEP